MISEKMGHFFDKPLGYLAKKISFQPNTVTITGFVVTLMASFVLISNFFFGGILILAGGFFDILDGVVARVNGKSSRFGAFLDSVLDRYSDASILLAIAWHFINTRNYVDLAPCLATLVGAFFISYSRARAEGLGTSCTYGLMERPERLLLISFGAISGFLREVLWLLAVLTHFTVVQRIYYVRRAMHGEKGHSHGEHRGRKSEG
jgi:phosphatidylglycerophosphate synthase